jgi:hypothetical protein
VTGTLRPIWVTEPRPPCFPQSPKLERLLENYDRRLGRFKLRMQRRHARDLRKGLFGPKDVRRKVPGRDGGTMGFDLPKGWFMRLLYYPTRGGSPKSGWEAGDVVAEFFPPRTRAAILRKRQAQLPAETLAAGPAS